MAAAKKTLRGAALVKKAIEASTDKIDNLEPVEASTLKKLRLPNDEKLPAGLKTFLAHDSSWLGWAFDDEEPEFEPMSLDELVAQELGDPAVPTFGEAIELLSEDCILIDGGSDSEADSRSFLYVGTPDDSGEYPVITLELGESAKVSGFVPFDVWIAQRFGALPATLPSELDTVIQALAESNADGRIEFVSESRDITASDKDDGDEDEDDEDKDEVEDEDEDAEEGHGHDNDM